MDECFVFNKASQLWGPKPFYPKFGSWDAYEESSEADAVKIGCFRLKLLPDFDFKTKRSKKMYFVPKPEIQKVTFHDKLLSASLQELPRLLTIFIFCPDVKKLDDGKGDPDARVMARLRTLGVAVQEAKRRKADVFVGPECFFSHNSALLDFCPPNAGGVLYSQSQKERVAEVTRNISRDVPNMLFIPGTCIWIDKDRCVRNTAFINWAGGGMHTQHSKKTNHAEENYASREGGRFVPGNYFCDFRYRRYQCRYQICADMQGGENEIKDLQILSGLGAGVSFSHQSHRGGCLVVSDGDGCGKVIVVGKKGELTKLETPDNGGQWLCEYVDMYERKV